MLVVVEVEGSASRSVIRVIGMRRQTPWERRRPAHFNFAARSASTQKLLLTSVDHSRFALICRRGRLRSQ
jgi:hypothetical protein